jgi:hypothetical protein
MLRGARAPFALRRMVSARLLIGALLLAILLAAVATTALASFGARALPAAAHQRLAAIRQTTIGVVGQIGARQASTDTSAISMALRAALPDIPVTLLTGRWSSHLALSQPTRTTGTPLIQAAALDRVQEHAQLLAGSWPGPPRPGQPIPVVLPFSTAGMLGLHTGSVLSVRDSLTGAPAMLRVGGLFRPLDPAGPYWQLSLLGTAGRQVRGTFVTYGPMLVSPAALAEGRLNVEEASWLASPDLSRADPGSLGTLASRLGAAVTSLQNDQSLGGLQVTTGLPELLSALASSLVVSRSLLVIGSLQLLLIAATAVALGARLLASHREPEAALLAARGMDRGQLARPALAEAGLLALSAAGAGALIGGYLSGMLLRASGLTAASPFAGGPSSWPVSVWASAAAIAILAVAVVIWPVLRPTVPGAALARRGRQAVLAGAAQAGVDLALLGLGVLAFWQLRKYSAAPRLSGGSLGIDPVLSAAPALALAGTAMLPLRVLPAAARALDRLSDRGRRLGLALAAWRLSRRPLRQGGPLLLVVLAVATGTLALAEHQSWRQSQLDRAAFQAGADVRVGLSSPLPLANGTTIAALPGVRAAMPVSSFSNGTSQVIAVGAGSAAATVLLRSDLSPAAPDQLWRLITSKPFTRGLALPGRAARLQITAALRPPTAQQLGPFTVTLTVQDATGIGYSVAAGALPADGRSHGLVAVLSPSRQAAYPLRVLGVSLSYQLPVSPPPSGSAAAASEARLTIGALAVSPAMTGGFASPFANGSALQAWHGSAAAPLLAEPGAAGIAPSASGLAIGAGGAASVSFGVGYGHLKTLAPLDGELSYVAPSRHLVAIPGIATREFLGAANVVPGGFIPVQVGNEQVPVRIAAVIRAFPTAGTGPAVIVNLATLEEILATAGQPPLAVGQWWLQTAGSVVPRGLPPASSAVSLASAGRSLLTDPLPNVPQLSLIVIATAAALLAAIGFTVSVAASVLDRRTQTALLAALGVGRAAQAAQLCLEQLMLSLPAAGAGALLGVLLAHLLVPAVTLTSAAAVPFPPPLVVVPLAWTVLVALAVAAVPVLAAAATLGYQPDPAAQLRAAETG